MLVLSALCSNDGRRLKSATFPALACKQDFVPFFPRMCRPALWWSWSEGCWRRRRGCCPQTSASWRPSASRRADPWPSLLALLCAPCFTDQFRLLCYLVASCLLVERWRCCLYCCLLSFSANANARCSPMAPMPTCSPACPAGPEDTPAAAPARPGRHSGRSRQPGTLSAQCGVAPASTRCFCPASLTTRAPPALHSWHPRQTLPAVWGPSMAAVPLCTHRWDCITYPSAPLQCGTVDDYQGQEERCIFISTTLRCALCWAGLWPRQRHAEVHAVPARLARHQNRSRSPGWPLW